MGAQASFARSTRSLALTAGKPLTSVVAGRALSPPNRILLARHTGIQTKLRLSQPGDRWEREADRVAESVVTTGVAAPVASASGVGAIQRACAECEEERMVAGQEAEEDTAEVEQPEEEAEEVVDDSEPDITGMPKRRGSGDAASVAESVIPTGSGSRLEPGVRSNMEQAFGRDFSGVRVHTGAAAARSADRLGALAYTVGSNIYFSSGQYSPSTSAGGKLLAHEMTHVVQQKGAPVQVSRQPRRRRGGNICSAGNCPQGKQSRVIRNDCSRSGPADESDFITHLEVALSAQTVTATWSGGRTDTWTCSPNPRVTPTGRDRVGVKCSIDHTNRKKDGMAWFTSFRSEGLRIGFHDSQRVGAGIHSHGCVRVCCSVARIINANTWSGRTTINVT